MKLSIFLFLLLAGLSIQAAAQTKTRDILFPSFQKDFSKLQSSVPEKSSKEAQFRGRSTKELIFNDYKPSTPPNTARMAAPAAGKKAAIPSDINNEAAAAATRKSAQPVAPFKIPDQGEEPKNNGSKPLKNKP
ncbi:hypothetical protein SAMN04488128_101254 [Chitinophaga eiseniae]|uniref:Uncharacterized protein n=1 Tax=Chitinophaga eiseniae TaxID=634771 RepID=A0A1T4KQN1_9BACT|nr:hypothetical protein [Chitinophaga eiseniae]SJZ44712.1 hypothetical protein SAMN04488128_101254 [Chitinophaga eiseniae]